MWAVPLCPRRRNQARSLQHVNSFTKGTFRRMKRPETWSANVSDLVEMTVEISGKISGTESEPIHGSIPEVESERRCPNVGRIREATRRAQADGEGLKGECDRGESRAHGTQEE